MFYSMEVAILLNRKLDRYYFVSLGICSRLYAKARYASQQNSYARKVCFGRAPGVK